MSESFLGGRRRAREEGRTIRDEGLETLGDAELGVEHDEAERLGEDVVAALAREEGADAFEGLAHPRRGVGAGGGSRARKGGAALLPERDGERERVFLLVLLGERGRGGGGGRRREERRERGEGARGRDEGLVRCGARLHPVRCVVGPESRWSLGGG